MKILAGFVGGWALAQGRWHHPSCLSLCPWTEPCQGAAASSGVHSVPRRLAASQAAHPVRPSPGQPGRTRGVGADVRSASPAAAGAGHHHPTRAR